MGTTNEDEFAAIRQNRSLWQKPEEDGQDMGYVERAKKEIEKHYNKLGKLSEIGNMVGLSYNQLERQFKKKEGCTLGQYVTRVRINHVKEELRSTSKGILSIAYGNGYHSLSNFYKQFKKFTGMTPVQFRNKEMGNGN